MMMVIMVLVLTYVDKHRKITMKEAKCCIHCFEVCGNGRICVFDRASQNLMIPMQQQQQQQPIAVGVRVLKVAYKSKSSTYDLDLTDTLCSKLARTQTHNHNAL
jgi:hypothetical protein